ncbi:MAG: hypothetical protein JSS07_02620 [Proteobacteria bacterium]|nr:hypothetical protein [Pseudomonadota bacterium]
MNKGVYLILLLSSGMMGNLLAADIPLSEDIKQKEQQLQKDKQLVRQTKESGADDKDILLICNMTESMLEDFSFCYREKEEIDIRICLDESLKKLAQKNNFIAQMEVGNIYRFDQQLQAALIWYKKAIENPQTPARFKDFILEMIEKSEAQLQDPNNIGPGKDEVKEVNNYYEMRQKMLKDEIHKAERLNEKEFLIVYKEAQVSLDAQMKCLKLKDALDAKICINKAIKDKAQSNNFVAQHQLGNIYENGYDNKAMAIKWYNAALKNARTPKAYKREIEEDLKRVRSKTRDTHPKTVNKG